MATATDDLAPLTDQVAPKKRVSFFGRRRKGLDADEGREHGVKTRKLAATDDTATAKEKQSGPLTDLSNIVTRSKTKVEKSNIKDGGKSAIPRVKSDKAKKISCVRRPTLKKDKDKKDTMTVTIPEPKIVDRVEPMELTNISPINLPSLLTRRPSNVPDIDKGDHFYCPEYAQDIITFSQASEQKWVLSEDFMSKSPLISSHMRAVLTDWLVQVQVHLSLLDHTLHLCVALIDKYICKKAITLNKMQLLGITALFVAAKYYERFPPEINTLTHLTDNTYSYDEIIDMERLLLKVMNFDINYPTPTFFLDRFLMIEENADEVEFMCQYLLDLLLISAEVSVYPSSLRAAASLYVARVLIQCSDVDDAWTLSLAYYTKYSESQLLLCAKCMAALTSNVNSQKYQGAHAKYSSQSKFSAISHHESIQSCLLVDIIDAILSKQGHMVSVPTSRAR